MVSAVTQAWLYLAPPFHTGAPWFQTLDIWKTILMKNGVFCHNYEATVVPSIVRGL
jgi:hypothetical protein